MRLLICSPPKLPNTHPSFNLSNGAPLLSLLHKLLMSTSTMVCVCVCVPAAESLKSGGFVLKQSSFQPPVKLLQVVGLRGL